jgi:Golgi phosphoprotein 3 (GPP34)
VASSAPTCDPVLDEVLRQVGEEEKPRKLQWWVYRVGAGGWRRPAIRNRLIDHLTGRGVLTRDEERLLGLIPVTRHPPAEPTADDQARAEVREVLVGGRDPDEPTAALVALVEAAGLVDACVDRSEHDQARRRAKQIAAGDQVGEAVRRVQQEAMAAVTVAIAAATTTAVAGSSGGS